MEEPPSSKDPSDANDEPLSRRNAEADAEEPSSSRVASDDAEAHDARDDTSTATRADRLRRRVADHPVGSVIVVTVGLIGTVGATVGGVRQIVDLVNGSDPPAITTSADTAVQLDPSELKTAKNSRYGLSFQYPATWQRQDPVNGDGLRAIGPEPGLELLAYGRLPSLGPSPDDAYGRLDYQVRQLADTPGTRIVEEPTQQNVTRFLPGGDTTEMAGMRFVMETDAGEETPAVTTVALATTTRERDVEMLCQVPTSLYPRWRGACNQFLSTLTLTR